MQKRRLAAEVRRKELIIRFLGQLHELRRRQKRYGLASACIGGGQGIAMIVERT